MKALLLSIFLILTANVSVQAAPSPNQIVLGVVSDMSRADFSAKFENILKEQMKNCSSCELVNLTPYNAKGELDRAALPKALEQIPAKIQILYVAWNEVMKSDLQPVVEALTKVTRSNVVLIAAAGEAVGDSPSHSLSRTLIGKVPDAIIIGELNDKESLLKKSYYGPEMLTAIKPPQDMRGEGVAPSLFATRLAREWNKKSQSEWVSHFMNRKRLSKRIWPGMDEFFNR